MEEEIPFAYLIVSSFLQMPKYKQTKSVYVTHPVQIETFWQINFGYENPIHSEKTNRK